MRKSECAVIQGEPRTERPDTRACLIELLLDRNGGIQRMVNAVSADRESLVDKSADLV